MTADLERLMKSAHGQRPSDEFRARLRAQIVAETEGADSGTVSADWLVDQSPDASGPADDIEVVYGAPQEHSDELAVRRAAISRRAGLFGAAAAAVAIVVGGIWLLTDDNESELDTIDVPAVTTTTTVVLDDELDANAASQPLTAGNTVFEAGTFSIDTLGTPFTFEVEEATGTLLNENGVVSITALASSRADDRSLTFRRTSFLPDPANPTEVLDRATGWPATDVSGWLENISDEVTVGDAVETTLGGLAATRVDIVVLCPDVTTCRSGDSLVDPNLPMFHAGSRYQMWVVDQGVEDPIVVTSAVDGDTEVDRAWLERAEGVLASLEFGPIVPNPVTLRLAGLTELDVFDGVRFELAEDATAVEPYEGFARLIPTAIDGDVEFLTRPLDVEGEGVESIERMLEILRGEAVFVTDTGPLEVGGVAGRSFEVESGGTPNIVLKTRTDDLVRSEFGWEPPVFGHLWLIEHPERGFLVVSVEVSREGAEDGTLREQTDSLLASLEFTNS